MAAREVRCHSPEIAMHYSDVRFYWAHSPRKRMQYTYCILCVKHALQIDTRDKFWLVLDVNSSVGKGGPGGIPPNERIGGQCLLPPPPNIKVVGHLLSHTFSFWCFMNCVTHYYWQTCPTPKLRIASYPLVRKIHFVYCNSYKIKELWPRRECHFISLPHLVNQ